MGRDQVRSKAQKYQRTSNQKVLIVNVSKPVWQKDGSCKAVVALDFAYIRGTNQSPMWLIKPDIMAKKFEIEATTGTDVKGKYVTTIQDCLRKEYNRRLHAGDSNNEAWFTDPNKNFNYRVLAGVIDFHGLKKNDSKEFASELDLFKESLENMKSDDTFAEDYVFLPHFASMSSAKPTFPR